MNKEGSVKVREEELMFDLVEIEENERNDDDDDDDGVRNGMNDEMVVYHEMNFLMFEVLIQNHYIHIHIRIHIHIHNLLTHYHHLDYFELYLCSNMNILL